MKKYLVIVEKTETGYSAYSPDFPGCGSTGSTREEVERNIRDAIEFHVEALKEDGYGFLSRPATPHTSTWPPDLIGARPFDNKFQSISR